jgi:tRNA1Val (adenine37-N6)-methyltransferase
MGNSYFKFKQFTIHQDKTAMKVGVDGVLLGAWVDVGEAQNILDIGTGTGLLALMLAQKTNANFTAVEIDEEAAKQASTNFQRSLWRCKITIENVSIQEFTESTTKKFELIVCNPPYFSASLNSPDNQRNLARHDNTLQLEDLFFSVNKLLSKNGRFCVIYPFDREGGLLELADKYQLFPNRQLYIKGTELKVPNRLIVEFSFSKKEVVKSELIVRNSQTNDYTVEYKNLTKDYYLKF